jgi:hypothetical protein
MTACKPGLTIYLPGAATLIGQKLRWGHLMIYFGDTIKCDDTACTICVGLYHEYGRDFGHNRCQQCGVIDCDLMMIHTALWERIAEDPTLLLCPDCMDQRLVHVRGFGIAPGDLTDCPINHLLWPRLMAEQGVPALPPFFYKSLIESAAHPSQEHGLGASPPHYST